MSRKWKLGISYFESALVNVVFKEPNNLRFYAKMLLPIR